MCILILILDHLSSDTDDIVTSHVVRWVTDFGFLLFIWLTCRVFQGLSSSKSVSRSFRGKLYSFVDDNPRLCKCDLQHCQFSLNASTLIARSLKSTLLGATENFRWSFYLSREIPLSQNKKKIVSLSVWNQASQVVLFKKDTAWWCL